MSPRRRARAPRAWRAFTLLGVTLLAAGCGIHGLRRTEVAREALGTAPREKATLKAHLPDGGVIVFDTWTLDPATRVVSGRGRLLDVHRVAGPEQAHRVAVDSVALFESDQLTVPGEMVAITVLSGVHGLLTALCLTNPKACFGSCPTFHAWDGERQALVAEAF